MAAVGSIGLALAALAGGVGLLWVGLAAERFVSEKRKE
jgi:hypothetical protein